MLIRQKIPFAILFEKEKSINFKQIKKFTNMRRNKNVFKKNLTIFLNILFSFKILI